MRKTILLNERTFFGFGFILYKENMLIDRATVKSLSRIAYVLKAWSWFSPTFYPPIKFPLMICILYMLDHISITVSLLGPELAQGGWINYYWGHTRSSCDISIQ